MIIKDALCEAMHRLRSAGIPDPARDARILVAHAIDASAAGLAARTQDALSESELARVCDVVSERCAGKPVSMIKGWREFWGRDFRVTPDVLDPRPETEALINALIANGPGRRVLDLGTGSGIISITLALEWPDATCLAVDRSKSALSVARENARLHWVGERIEFRTSDWWDSVLGTFDVIVSNPPYISDRDYAALDPNIRRWEPEAALRGGSDGLIAYRTIFDRAREFLAAEGMIAVEMGYDQPNDVSNLASAAGLGDVRIHRDMNGHERVLTATR